MTIYVQLTTLGATAQRGRGNTTTLTTGLVYVAPSTTTTIARRGVTRTGIGILMLFLIVQLLLMLLRLGYEDDGGKTIFRLYTGIRL